MRKLLTKPLIGSFSATAGAVSGTNVYTTQFQPIDSFESYGIQIVWTGTPVATVTIEISMDPVPQLGYSAGNSLPQPVNFDTASSSSVNTSGSTIITYDNIRTNATWIRLKWTNTSGSGTVTSINLVAKGSDV